MKFLLKNYLQPHTIILAAFALISFSLRLWTMPRYIETIDSYNFVRALDHYSVVDYSPHWPGYPVYIWFGALFHRFVPDPAAALHLLSIAASTLTLWPLAALAINWRKKCGGNERDVRLTRYTTALLWAVIPLSWLDGSEIFSDPPGLLLAVTLLWLCQKALDSQRYALRWLLAGAIIGGLMVGVRLSYVPLLLALIYAVFKVWYIRSSTKTRIIDSANPHPRFSGFLLTRAAFVPISVFAVFAFVVVLWLAWQFLQDGLNFITAGREHLVVHYAAEGGRSAVTDSHLLTRPLRFAERFIIFGLGGWWPGLPLVRLVVAIGLGGLLACGLWQVGRSAGRDMQLLLLLWVVPYALWVILSNDVDLARYYFPLVALVCMLAGIGLPTRRFLAAAAVGVVCVALTLVTVPLALAHATDTPLGSKLAAYTRTHLVPQHSVMFVPDNLSALLIFTQREAPMITSTRLSPLASANFSDVDRKSNLVYKVDLPNQAEDGWSPVVRLCREPLLHSRDYHELWIYRLGTLSVTPPSLDCYDRDSAAPA